MGLPRPIGLAMTCLRHLPPSNDRVRFARHRQLHLPPTLTVVVILTIVRKQQLLSQRAKGK